MMKFEQLEALLTSNRSIRRFDQSHRVSDEDMRKLVSLTRLCASGRNLQPLRYRIITSERECAEIFPTLAWAGYYKDWAGPAEGERPVAYLVQCLDTRLTDNPLCDEGLHLQTITLGAVSLGLNCCIIKAFNARKVSETLQLPQWFEPRYVLAIGYAAERARIVSLNAEGDYRYYRDEADVQCVPKRELSDLIID